MRGWRLKLWWCCRDHSENIAGGRVIAFKEMGMRNIPQIPRRRGGIPWRRTMAPSSALMVCFPAAFVFMLAGIGGAVSGPCADQIAQLERQVAATARLARKPVRPRRKASARNCIGSRRPARSKARRASQLGTPTMRSRAPNKPMPPATVRIATRRWKRRGTSTESVKRALLAGDDRRLHRVVNMPHRRRSDRPSRATGRDICRAALAPERSCAQAAPPALRDNAFHPCRLDRVYCGA